MLIFTKQTGHIGVNIIILLFLHLLVNSYIEDNSHKLIIGNISISYETTPILYACSTSVNQNYSAY